MNTVREIPQDQNSTVGGEDLLDAFVLGLTDIVDPAVLLGDGDLYVPPAVPLRTAESDGERIAGYWRRVGGYLAQSMATEAAHGKE